MDDYSRNTQGQQASPNRIVSKRLPNGEVFTIDRQADEPAIGPFKISYDRMLQLSVTVWTDNQQVTRMMANLRVKMVYFKVRLSIPLLEGERAKLTSPIVQLSKQDASSRRYTLVALGRTGNYPWARLAYRALGDTQQLLLGQLSSVLSGQP
ncbi:MAG TPA: hypothetical protein VKV15_05150 [Bryobacteraceae bacterium]|nr:hypothetical protein [Bryobacteraceae bacterium]